MLFLYVIVMSLSIKKVISDHSTIESILLADSSTFLPYITWFKDALLTFCLKKKHDSDKNFKNLFYQPQNGDFYSLNK